MADGRPLRLLTVVDEYTRQCLAIRVGRHLRADEVLRCLTEMVVAHSVPAHLRADSGPEFTAHAVRTWLRRVGSQTLFIELGSPWENADLESFNGKLRDELLDRVIFYTLREAPVLIEHWRRTYNQIRLHLSLGNRPPAPQAIRPASAWPATSTNAANPKKAPIAALT